MYGMMGTRMAAAPVVAILMLLMHKRARYGQHYRPRSVRHHTGRTEVRTHVAHTLWRHRATSRPHTWRGDFL